MRLIFKSVILSFLLDVILALSLPAATQFSIAIQGVEKSTGRQYTIYFGHDPQATRCLDTALGERPYPPPPPGFTLVWTRFSVPAECYPPWLGPMDLRPANSLRDTFQLYVNANGLLNALTDTVTLSWSDLTSFGGPVELRYFDDAGLHSLDMKSASSLVLETSQYGVLGFRPTMKIYARLYSDDIPPMPVLSWSGTTAAILALAALGIYFLKRKIKSVRITKISIRY